MHLHLFLLFFVLNSITKIESIENSSTNLAVIIRTELRSCDTNRTLIFDEFSAAETVFNAAINSCEQICCTINRTSNTNICQATVLSPGGNCLGRLCYFGTCDHFLSLMNVTVEHQLKMNKTINRTIQSPLAFIPWSSVVRSSYTQWRSWIQNSSFTTQHLIVTLLSITNIFLTLIALSVVIRSIKHANLIAGRKAYRYTLL